MNLMHSLLLILRYLSTQFSFLLLTFIKGKRQKSTTTSLHTPLISEYSIIFYASALCCYLILPYYISTVLLKFFTFCYVLSFLIHVYVFIGLIFQYLVLRTSSITFMDCTPFNSASLLPLSINRYLLLNSILSTWVFYRQVCIIGCYLNCVHSSLFVIRVGQTIMFTLILNHTFLLFIPKQIVSVLFHTLFFIMQREKFVNLMYTHSKRNVALNYSCTLQSSPFNLGNLENFFKLEVFGIQLFYLNRRLLLVYPYKLNLPFMVPYIPICLEAPLGIEVMTFKRSRVFCDYMTVKDDYDHPDQEDLRLTDEDAYSVNFFAKQRLLFPETGLSLDFNTTFLGVNQKVNFQRKRIRLSFPGECFILFQLYFEAVENLLLHLSIFDNVSIK